MGCGQQCPDCSFEDSMAYATYQLGPDDEGEEPRADTPPCCMAVRKEEERWRQHEEDALLEANGMDCYGSLSP